MTPKEEYTIYQHPPAKFRLQFVKDPHGLTFNLQKGPNAFHRWMQKICFGFFWEKL
jgi:hypothetical protein